MARKTTVLFVWDAGAPPITSLGVHEFLKNEVRLEEADLVGIQVDIPLKKVWVKFVAEDLCFDVVQHGRYEYKHGNGEISIVRAQGAGLGSRLVRVFRLPFEVSNLKLSAELSKYGKVIGGVQDERFDDKHVFKVRTGVRRARVEISQHIPSYITVDNQKCLVMYAGQPATCGICNLPGHLRKQCPEKGKPKSFSAALRGADDGENMDETEIDCSLYVDQGGYGTAEPTSSGTSPLTQGQPAARGPAGEQQHGTAQQEDGDTPREQRLHLEEAAVETVPTAAAGDGPPGGPSGRPARFVFDSSTLADGWEYQPPTQTEIGEKRGGGVGGEPVEGMEIALEAAAIPADVTTTPAEGEEPFVVIGPNGKPVPTPVERERRPSLAGGVQTRQTRSRAGSGSSVGSAAGGPRKPLTPVQMSALATYADGNKTREPSFMKRAASTILGGNSKKQNKENKN